MRKKHPHKKSENERKKKKIKQAKITLQEKVTTQ